MISNPYSRKSKYCYVEVKNKKYFDPRSFRTILLGKKGEKGTVACPKGQWDARTKSCKVGMQLQRKLVPTGMKSCRIGGRVIQNPQKRKWYIGILKNMEDVVDIFSSSTQPTTKHYRMTYQYVVGPFSSDTTAQIAAVSSKKHILHLNPRQDTEIYSDILAIEAKKGKQSLWPNKLFRHEFKPGSKIYGRPDGSIIIKAKGEKKLWKNFQYSKEDIES